MPAYRFQGLTPIVEPGAYVHPEAVLIGDVLVSAGCFVGPGAVLRGDIARLVMLPGSNLQDLCIVHSFPGRETTIGKDAHVGHGAVLHGCTVDQGAMIGIHALVMDDARIGEYAFVAANALVKAGTLVPPRTLVAGTPAKVVRPLRDDEIAWKVDGTRIYQSLARQYLRSATRVDPLPAPEPNRPSLPEIPHTPLHERPRPTPSPSGEGRGGVGS
ncbi:MAG: phenylacetic acid degradation protein PaaY [Phycisphaerae bacterium]|nr:phenylacetic acid degradation protein PaaY [Phycisphaerae bacterium]